MATITDFIHTRIAGGNVSKKTNSSSQKITEEIKTDEAKRQEKRDWETPKLEDVSDQVMAQPYIRFT